MIAGELVNILGFKLEGEQNLRKFNKGMDDAEAKAKGSQDRIRRLGTAAGIATTAVIGLAVSGYKNFAAFELQMTRIGITAGATAQATQRASDRVKQLAYDFGLPIDQAVSGLDTLVASGMSLEKAMEFLPSVLATAQAAGAATEDIANTAIKASTALGIEADRMQAAFDIMVAGGKAGQFELKDMASFIPNLANSFANLGYQGEEGLQKLIAILQTLRTSTGDAGTAATAAGEIFGKMLAPEVVKNFSELNTDIKKEMAEAKAAGEDLMKAYVRISQETLKNNPKATLVDLFSDKQMRDGMLTLMKMGDAWRDFDAAVSSSDVAGGTLRDLGVILDTQAVKINRLSTSWDNFMKSIGAAASGPIGSLLDAASDAANYDAAVAAGQAKRREKGEGSFGIFGANRAQIAREGGYAPTAADRATRDAAPDAYRVLGRYPRRPNSTVATPGPVRRESMFDAGGSSKALFDQIQAMNANMANMAAGAGAGATITDARTTSVKVDAPVTVNVSSPTAAPGAVGNAVSSAIGKAATGAATRIESEPATP